MGAQHKTRGGGKNRLQNWDESEFQAYADWKSDAYAGYSGGQSGNSQSASPLAHPEGPRSLRSSALGEGRSRHGSSSGSMQGGRSW